MPDVLVERVLATGSDQEDTSRGTSRAGVMINVAVSDAVLWGDSDEAGHVDGYGPIPADLAREFAFGSDLGDLGRRWLRRLYTRPETGSLVAMDSSARLVPTGLARFPQTPRPHPWHPLVRRSHPPLRPRPRGR